VGRGIVIATVCAAVMSGGVVALTVPEIASASAAQPQAVVPPAGSSSSSGEARNRRDRWAGEWSFTIDVGNGTTSQGRLVLQVNKGGHDEAFGRYDAGTSGRVWGALQNEDGDTVPFGRIWCGRFVDDVGQNRSKGRFCATVYRDDGNDHFYGWYKPSNSWVTSYDWWGSKVVE
jgi:hypothetical protein